jgi:hypothetical protein
MDVSLSNARVFFSVLVLCIFLVPGCGNRYDLSTERGRQARIDDANFFLSKGECSNALEAILPVYNSSEVNDEVRIVTASAYACAGTFNMLTMLGNILGASNFLSVMAKSLGNSPGDGARSSFYQAVDVLTQAGSHLEASSRSSSVNTYMVFLQMGVIGSILRNYGAPGADGSQTTDLVYDGHGGSPAGEMSDTDACALSASLSLISDSYRHSSLTDSDTAALVNSIDSLCIAAGLTSCSDLNKSRSACDGSNADSQNAELVVDGVNNAW